MRKRTMRDLGTIAGVLVIILAVGLYKSFTERGDLRARMIAWRNNIEQERGKMGVSILNWKDFQATKGTLRTGPTFNEELKKQRDVFVNIVGFTVPLYEFHDVKEFLLLPMPLSCYFCQLPPMRDVIYVKVAENTKEKVQIVNEPVLINGTLRLNEGPGTKFFYTIEDAKLGPGDPSVRGGLTAKTIAPEHMAESEMNRIKNNPEMDTTTLYAPDEPPSLEEAKDALQKPPATESIPPVNPAPATDDNAAPVDGAATPPPGAPPADAPAPVPAIPETPPTPEAQPPVDIPAPPPSPVPDAPAPPVDAPPPAPVVPETPAAPEVQPPVATPPAEPAPAPAPVVPVESAPATPAPQG